MAACVCVTYYYPCFPCATSLLSLPIPHSSPIEQQPNNRYTITDIRLSTMAGNNKCYYSLPTQPPQQQRSGSRRPPLTPSTVSSPCLSIHAPVVTRRDSGSGSPTKAEALLAKVVANPVSPKGESPPSSPMSSPTTRPAEMHSSPMYSPERPAVWRSESARYVRQYREQGKHPSLMTSNWELEIAHTTPDGYISFPDFEKFGPSPSPYDNQHREHTAVET
jgi:hypothetical protein